MILWEKIGRREMESRNAVFSKRIEGEVTLAGKRYAFRLQPDFPEPYAPAASLRIHIGAKSMRLDVDRLPEGEALNACLGAHGLASSLHLPEALRGAWLESLLEESLDAAESALGEAIALDPLDSVTHPDGDCLPLHFRLEGDAGAFRARLHVLRAEFPWICERLIRLAPKTADAWIPDDAMPLRVHFRVGSMRLDWRAFFGLEAGDILLPEEELLSRRRVRVASGGRMRVAALAAWDGNQLLLEEPMSMEELKPPATGAARGWEELDLEIDFDVGEGLFPLGEVRAWKPGVILPLPGNPEGRVRIRVNGKAAGVGALLMIDGRAGIRILSLGMEPGAGDPVDRDAATAPATAIATAETP